MKKIFALLSSIVFLFVAAVVVSAQSSNATIPERNGDYPDPEHPGVRVHVFVHEPKEKPTTSVSSAVCDDPGSNAVDATAGWHLPNTTWKYKVNTSSAPSTVGGSNLLTIAQKGFDTWVGSISSSSSSKPTLSYDGTTDKNRKAFDGQNIVTFGRASGTALGVTYVWYYTSNNQVAEVDTILNKQFAWSLNVCSPDSYDANDILMHEQGHWFGEDDNYAAVYADNTMFGYGSKGETKKITPAQGDIDAINLIYH